MLALNIAPLCRARGIERPFSFLTKNGFSNHTASNLINHWLTNINPKHMEKLCILLTCEPSDLFIWTPDKHTNLPETHPLQRLKQENLPETDLLTATQNLPYKQLKEITKKIQEELNPKTHPPENP